MRKIFESIRHSLSARLSIWVVLFAALIYTVTQIYVSDTARRSVRKEAIQGATQILENTVLRMNSIIEDVELSADQLEWLVYRHLDSPESMLEYSRNAVNGKDFLTGCSIAFEPWFFKDRQYFSAYTSNTDGELVTRQEGSDDYQYFYLDWYLYPKLLNQPCWTEPYNDWEFDDEYNLATDMLLSYCKPLTDDDGTFIGVISMDISLKWLSETISQVKPFPNSYNILISRGGTFLVHPDPEKLFYQTIFTETLSHPDPKREALGQSMINWKEGMNELVIDGKDSYVFYKPIKSTGWSVAIVCPEKDIFSGFNRLRTFAEVMILLGLTLMFIVSYFVIRKTMRPLKVLATEAGNIASGHFEHALPLSTRVDEIGTLNNSFANMQSSLVSYIDELTLTTARKERMESEIQIARSIQMGMVPRTFPPFPERKEIDLYASINPAREVGGDLYDYFLLKDKLYFCIADVSGKGVPASLFMAVARSLFRLVGQQGCPPAEIARQINDTLAEENEQMMFVTTFIGVLDLASGSLEFCNCGHNPPVLISGPGAAPVFLECKPNTPLGCSPGWTFEGQVLEDLRGATLFLYTDGLNEAENEAHEQFSDARLLEELKKAPEADSQTIIENMLHAVSLHVAGAEPSDDLTLLCLRLRR